MYEYKIEYWYYQYDDWTNFYTNVIAKSDEEAISIAEKKINRGKGFKVYNKKTIE